MSTRTKLLMRTAWSTSSVTSPKARSSLTSKPMCVSLRLTLAFSLRRGDLVEHAVIQLGAMLGLVGVGDVLAEVVDADARAPIVHHLGGANHVVKLRAGNEALREAQPHRRLLGEMAYRLLSESPMKSDLNMPPSRAMWGTGWFARITG